MPEITDFIPEIICVGVDCLICGVLLKAYQVTVHVIGEIKNAPVIVIDTNISQQIAANQQHSESGSSQVLPYAVIRGHVQALAKPLASHYANDENNLVLGVVQKFSILEHKRNLSRTGFCFGKEMWRTDCLQINCDMKEVWYDSERLVHDYVNHIPFCLTTKSKVTDAGIFSMTIPCVEVLDFQQAAKFDMDVTYDEFEPMATSWSSHVWGWMMGDMQRGVQKTEEMLTVGSEVTAIGELVIEDGRAKLQPPSNGLDYFVVKGSVRNLVTELEGGAKALKWIIGVLGSIGLVVAGVASYKYYNRYCEERVIQRNQESLRQIIAERERRLYERASERPPAEMVDSTSDIRLCVVCLTQEREVILLDCGHVCVCADCAAQVMNTRPICPVCRAGINRVLPAYLA